MNPVVSEETVLLLLFVGVGITSLITVLLARDWFELTAYSLWGIVIMAAMIADWIRGIR